MKCSTWRVSAQGCKVTNPGVTTSACAGVHLQGDQEEGAGSHSGYLAEQKTLQVIAGLGEPQLMTLECC